MLSKIWLYNSCLKSGKVCVCLSANYWTDWVLHILEGLRLFLWPFTVRKITWPLDTWSKATMYWKTLNVSQAFCLPVNLLSVHLFVKVYYLKCLFVENPQQCCPCETKGRGLAPNPTFWSRGDKEHCWQCY